MIYTPSPGTLTWTLPQRLQDAGFELLPDGDEHVTLWRNHAWVGRFHATAPNYPSIVETADAHLGSVAVS